MDVARDPPTYYHAISGTGQPRPALGTSLETQVCIIGGGLAGLSTALELASRGVDCVLLEARHIAWGASGRNGGFVADGYARGASALLRRLGPEHARALYRVSMRGTDLVRRRIADLGLTEARRCDGMLGVWRHHAPDEPARERDLMAERFGVERFVWPRERLRDQLDTPHYFHGLEDPRGFHIDPLAYARGVAAESERLGAQLFEQSPVTRTRLDGATKEIITPGGKIRAQDIVFTCGGYLGGLEPRLARAMLPIATYVVASEADPERVPAAIRCRHAVSDGRMANDYYRVVEGDRLLWGGRVTARTREPAQLSALLLRDLSSVFPQLSGLSIEFAWTGLMSYARHKMPQLGRLQPGAWYAMGFGGHGLNTTAAAGELLAAAIADGDDRWRLFSPFGLDWTGGPLGPLAVQLHYWAYQAGDRLRELRARRRSP